MIPICGVGGNIRTGCWNVIVLRQYSNIEIAVGSVIGMSFSSTTLLAGPSFAIVWSSMIGGSGIRWIRRLALNHIEMRLWWRLQIEYRDRISEVESQRGPQLRLDDGGGCNRRARLVGFILQGGGCEGECWTLEARLHFSPLITHGHFELETHCEGETAIRR